MSCEITPLRSQGPRARGGAPYKLDIRERARQLAAKPHIDVHVVDHCNLGCKGCVHFSPVAEPRFLDLAAYEADLRELARIPGLGSHLSGFSLMGGEPLLHPRLPEVIRLTRSCLPDAPIVLDSNGLLLKRMKEDFWDALVGCGVRLAISPYPLKVDYPALVELARSHGADASFVADVTRSDWGKEAFFQLALDSRGAQDPVYAFNRCPFGGVFMQLHGGRLWPCQVAGRSQALNRRFGTSFQPMQEDSLLLSEIRTVDDIEAFRRQAHPMCRYCDNDGLAVSAWARSARTPDEWISS